MRTSDADAKYNCIAWAANDLARWWWPTGYVQGKPAYWPISDRTVTVACFHEAFAVARQYEPCDSPSPERGYEKVALYVTSRDVPTHMARQVPSGGWTSKLGPHEDLTHHTLTALECSVYGQPRYFMRRRIA